MEFDPGYADIIVSAVHRKQVVSERLFTSPQESCFSFGFRNLAVTFSVRPWSIGARERLERVQRRAKTGQKSFDSCLISR